MHALLLAYLESVLAAKTARLEVRNPDLLAWVQDLLHGDPSAREAAGAWVRRQGVSVVPSMLGLLRYPHRKVHDWVEETLLSFGPPVVPVLREQIRIGPRSLRGEIERLLGRLEAA